MLYYQQIIVLKSQYSSIISASSQVLFLRGLVLLFLHTMQVYFMLVVLTILQRTSISYPSKSIRALLVALIMFAIFL
jgi:hypothetical protein